MFKLQIVDENNRVVVSPFAAGKLEMDLVEACVQAIVAQGVGMFVSEATVAARAKAGMIAAIQALKDQTRPVAGQIKPTL